MVRQSLQKIAKVILVEAYIRGWIRGDTVKKYFEKFKLMAR